MDEKLAAVPVEVSARHIHLSQADQDALFGEGYEMHQIKDLSQTGQWAAEEEVTAKGPKGELTLRVLGPCRSHTQVELARTDCFKFGVKPALRLSGHHDDTPGCTLVGPKGEITIDSGVIVPIRHIHIRDTEAEERGLKNGDTVKVEVAGDRGITFENVKVRVHESFRLHMHLDTDEGNAVWAEREGTTGRIITE